MTGSVDGIGTGTTVQPMRETQRPTGLLAGFRATVGEAFARVGEAFRSFGRAIAEFFTSLFSLSVRQEASEPRVGRGVDRATESLHRELSTLDRDDSVARTIPVEGHDVEVSWVFGRDLHGSGRYRLEGGPIIPEEDGYGNDNHGDKIAAVVGTLIGHFDEDCITLLSRFAHQGTFGALETVLGSPDTPLETEDGRKVYAQAENRTATIDISRQEDGSIRLRFDQELRDLQVLVPVSPDDTAPPPVPKEGATVRATFDIVLRRDGEGPYRAEFGKPTVIGDLGV